MKRRALLKSVVGGTAVGLTGCLNRESNTSKQNDTSPEGNGGNSEEEGGNNTDSGNNGNGSSESTDNSTETDNGKTNTDSREETNSGDEHTDSRSEDGGDGTNTAESEPALVDSSFEIVSAGCGEKKGGTATAFDNHTVRVTGTIRGKNSCYTAKLKNATLEQGTLTVTVRSLETGNSDVCAMCLKRIRYESTHTFKHEPPERVIVIHNDTQVESVKRK